jgi:hypothetical protein
MSRLVAIKILVCPHDFPEKANEPVIQISAQALHAGEAQTAAPENSQSVMSSRMTLQAMKDWHKLNLSCS